MAQDKQWELYLAKTQLQRRMMRDVRTPFENANLAPWVARLGECKSLRAVTLLSAEFETADRS